MDRCDHDHMEPEEAVCLCCQHHLCSHFQTTISCGRNSSSNSFFAQKWNEASQDVDAQKSDPGCSGSTGLILHSQRNRIQNS